MANGEDMENGAAKDIPPWLQPVPEEELQEVSYVSGKLKIAIIALAVLILSLFVAVIFYLYDDQASMPPIHVKAPETAFKDRPKDSGGMQVDHQDKVIFDQRDGVQERSEVRLGAQPEVPVDEIPEDQAGDPIASVIDSVEQAAEPVVKSTQETVKSAVSDAAKPEKKKAPVAKEPQVKEASVKEAAKPVVDLASKHRIQLGAYGNETSAARAWRTIKGQFASYLADKQPQYEAVQSGDRTLYRLRVGPYENRAVADQACLALRAKEQACIVVNP